MEERSANELRDYKFFCFGGVARCMKVDFNRFIDHHANYYDQDGNLLKFGEIICPPTYSADITMPSTFSQMKLLAEKLSEEKPFLRADFYNLEEKVYFGELTFYPATGLGKFTSDEWDIKLGEWLQIPDSFRGDTSSV